MSLRAHLDIARAATVAFDLRTALEAAIDKVTAMARAMEPGRADLDDEALVRLVLTRTKAALAAAAMEVRHAG